MSIVDERLTALCDNNVSVAEGGGQGTDSLKRTKGLFWGNNSVLHGVETRMHHGPNGNPGCFISTSDGVVSFVLPARLVYPLHNHTTSRHLDCKWVAVSSS